MIREILETVPREVIKTVNPQMEKVGGVRVGIPGAVVRCRDDDFGVRLRHTADLSHRPQNIGLVFEKAGEVILPAHCLREAKGNAQVGEPVGDEPGCRSRRMAAGSCFFFPHPMSRMSMAKNDDRVFQ